MWQYFRWYRSFPGQSAVPVEPTLRDLSINKLEFELLMSKEPTVQMLLNMDVHKFDVRSINYRLESIVFFSASLLSTFGAICACMFQKQIMNAKLTQRQLAELQRLKNEDRSYQQLQSRR